MRLYARTPLKRTFALAVTALAVHTSAWAAEDEIRIEADRIQQHLVHEFPRELEAFGGLMVLTAGNPRLRIPPRGARLEVAFDAGLGPAGTAATPLGRVHLSSSLRYDANLQALFLDTPALERFEPAQAGQALDSQTRDLLNLWLQDYARTEPLYRLDPRQLAAFGDLKVRSARVENGAVVVQFNQPVGMPDLSEVE